MVQKDKKIKELQDQISKMKTEKDEITPKLNFLTQKLEKIEKLEKNQVKIKKPKKLPVKP